MKLASQMEPPAAGFPALNREFRKNSLLFRFADAAFHVFIFEFQCLESISLFL
jgi:hypothetical protein